MDGWLTIVRKDLKEMVRDRRVLIGVFVMPMVIMVIFVSMFGAIEKKLGKEPDLKMGIVGQADAGLVQRLKEGKKPPVVVEAFESLEQAEAAQEKGDVKLIVQIPPTWDSDLSKGVAQVTLRFDQGSPLSMVAAGVVRKAVDSENLRLTQQALAQAGLGDRSARPIQVAEVNTSKAQGLGASSLSGLLPYLIVLFAFTAAASSAADLVAGEKERGTMETLMVSPPKRAALAIGKFASLCVVSLLGGSVAVVSLVLVGALRLSGSEVIFPKGVSIPPMALLTLVVLLIPLSMMYAAVMVAVSSAARTMREAQSYLAVLNLLVMGPAVASQVVGVTGMDKNPAIVWIPVLNTAIGIKNALGGVVDLKLGMGAVTTSLLLAVVAVVIAVWSFQREGFLRRT